MAGPGFTSVFGGSTIFPAQTSYLSLSISVNTALQWPLELATGGAPIVADIIDVTATTGGLSISFADATQVSTGYAALFNNVGANTFTVKDHGGNVIASIASGQAWIVYLADNSTVNGTWRVFQMGAGTSSANAATLAGAGLKAITTTLNQRYSILTKNVDYVIIDADRAKLIEWTGGTGALTGPDPTLVGTDWFCLIKNNGTGNVTFTPAAGTIDGSSNLTFAPDTSAFVISDGANFVTVGFGQQLNTVFDFVSIDVGGTGDFVLTGPQQNRISYQFTGILTGDRNIIVPNTIQQYWVDNETTGAFTLTVKTAAGAGVAIGQAARNILYCDGVDVVSAITFGSTGFADGAAAAPSIFFTSDPDTGIYHGAANEIGFATAGVNRFQIGNTRIALNVPAQLITDSVTVPGLYWIGDGNTGLYHIGADNIGATCGGVLSLDISSSRTIIPGIAFVGNGAVGAPSFAFNSDANTGFYRVGADDIGVACGGVLALEISQTVLRPLGVLQGANGAVGTPSMSFLSDTDTGFFHDTANQIGIALGGASAGEILQGTFTGTLTGCSTSPTQTFHYQVIGKICFIWIDAQLSATSNSANMTVTGVPAAITPSRDYFVACQQIIDNGNFGLEGTASVSAANAIVFNFMYTNTTANHVQAVGGAFTGAGTKGLGAGWCMAYPLG